MYVVRAVDEVGVGIDIGPACFPSIDMARGFSVAVGRWMRSISQREGEVMIWSNDVKIEGATFAYWSNLVSDYEDES